METINRREKEKKGMFKICPKTICTHSEGTNEQTLKIPVLNVPLVDFQNCTHDVIQVEQNRTACCKKDTHVYF